ncbi:hypothetical protein, partial [Roseobacter cerasinus]|uniref:hypothetical protein n=1 Tax=Roseobacter cerasinus TaxID=2602289 RepID=UPI001EEBFB24
SLVLFQNANDLFFAETASLHRLSPQLENRLTKIRGHFRGAGQGCGKTHFVTKLLEDDSFTDRKPIYLSVFGIADIQSFETSLF